MPIRGLHELRRMIESMHNHLQYIRCPVLIVQGSDDPVVAPSSAETIFDCIAHSDKEIKIVPSNRHGILNEDIANTQQLVLDFIARQNTRREPEPVRTIQHLQPT